MSNGLRYASVHHMPEHMRSRAMCALSTQDLRTPASSKKPRSDSEHQEQVAFFNLIRTLALLDKRYELAVRRTFAIPNGGGRSKREAGRLKAEGVKPGVSDIETSLPADGYHGLFIEMKSLTGSASREQKDWIQESLKLGYLAVVCRGAREAYTVWTSYVDATF